VILLNAIGVDSTRDYKITSTMEDIKQIWGRCKWKLRYMIVS
jgi:hypothetical protein